MTTMGAPVVRPNGKVYRPRKPVEITECGWGYDGEDGSMLIALRTHNPADVPDSVVARWLSNVDDWEGPPPTPRLEWLRLVPFDAHNIGCDSCWVTDSERGTPCVTWLAEWA